MNSPPFFLRTTPSTESLEDKLASILKSLPQPVQKGYGPEEQLGVDSNLFRLPSANYLKESDQGQSRWRQMINGDDSDEEFVVTKITRKKR